VNGYADRAAADLRWFFREGAGALGLKSNFGGMIASLEGGGWTPKPSHDVPLHLVEAAQRYRRIEERLERCTKPSRDILRWAFQEPDNDASLIAVLTHNAKAVQEWAESKTTRDIRDWLVRLRETSKDDYLRARQWLKLKALGMSSLECCIQEFGARQ